MKNLIAFFAILLYGAATAQIPTAGLLAYYPFCGNANDLSGNALHGTPMSGAVLTADRFGNPGSAYSFNGTSSYIDLPVASFTGMNVYSYSIWFKPANNSVALVYSVGGNDPFCQSLSYNTTSVSAGSYNVGSNPVQSYVFSNTIAGINNWWHVVVTRDMTALKMYVNGALMSQLPSANTNGQAASYGSTAPYKAMLGARSNLQYFFGGVIDDVRIYSTVLSPAAAAALYNEVPFPVSAGSGTICTGNSFSLQPSGAVSYTYSSGSPVVSPAVSSTYTITGASSQGCLSSAVATVVVSLCTDLPEPAGEAAGISIFPNPSTHQLTLNLKQPHNGSSHFVIEDLLGKLLLSYELAPGATQLTISPELPAGCYSGRWLANGSCLGTLRLLSARQ